MTTKYLTSKMVKNDNNYKNNNISVKDSDISICSNLTPKCAII